MAMQTTGVALYGGTLIFLTNSILLKAFQVFLHVYLLRLWYFCQLKSVPLDFKCSCIKFTDYFGGNIYNIE